jgi:flagellar basal body-associated protein FliL
VTLSIKHEYAIRAGVLDLLGSLTEAETSTPNFRADLAIRLRDNVNQTLTQVSGNGGVEEVLFTELVVQ